jgi:serine/threonine protein kinase
LDATAEDTELNPHTLQGQLAAHGALPPPECLKVGVSLARALAHLHSHELVHRDVKPSNIIYVGGKPKLVDVGLVARMDSTPSAVGTFGYIPYEGPGKTTADVFALGKVLYEMATGKDRYDFPELPAPDPELRGLNAIILKACADLPKERYANAVEMAEDLERVRDGHRPLDESTAIFNKLLATLVVLFVGVLAWKQWGKSDLPEPPEPSWRDGLEAHWPMDGHARDATAPDARLAARWDFEYSYSHILETNALKYLIRTNNVRPFIEWQKTPLTYWGPITNDMMGELVYHFPFARPVRRAHLRCTVNTWDFSGSNAGIGRGAAAIGVSTNGTDWVPLRNGLDPVPLWSTDGIINDELPAALMGATNYFIRVRMLKEDATDPDYTPVQHSRMAKLPGDKGFEFKVEME